MASLGLTDGVEALLKKGAYVNAKDKTGWTALMGAARKGHSDTVRALLEKGAYANAKDNNGWTALMSAAASPRAEAVEALLEKGAEVNAQDKTGWTALMGAAGSGQAESVRALLGKGDRKSTRLNSSHGYISYAVFCLKKKNHRTTRSRSHGRPRGSRSDREAGRRLGRLL